MMVGARQLDRRLDRLRAARGEEDPVQIPGRQRGDPCRQLDRARVRVAPHREEVELLHLARRGLAQLGAAMAGVDAEERREPVEVTGAVLVPHVGALAPDDDGHLAIVVGAVSREVHPEVPLGELLEIHSRGGGGYGGRCHLALLRRCFCLSSPYRRSVQRYTETTRRTTRIRFKDATRFLYEPHKELLPFWGFCPLHAHPSGHTLLGLSG